MRRSSIQVLHIDDEPDFTDLTASFLQREDNQFTVKTATSADEGLERIDDRPPDCVVSDYNMPGTDGLEFLQTVRTEYPDLPFILFTGRGSERVASDAIAADVTDYLQKGGGSEQYELLSNRIRNAVQARREAQRADRQEQLMRLTEFAGNTGGFELDRESNTVLLTAGTRRIIGRPDRDELPLEEAVELFHADDRERIWESLDRAFETGEKVHGTWRLQPDDGDERLLDITITPVVESGEIQKLRGAGHDITEQRERQAELRQSERRLNALLKHSTDRISILDADGCYKFVSPSAETLMGHDPDELTGDEAFEYIHPEDREKTRETLQQILDDPDGIYSVEYRYRDAEGSWRWVESRGKNRLDNPAIEGVVINSREITERKKREQELQQTRDLITNTEQLADAGAWEYDSETDSLTLTDGARQLYGLDPDESPTLDAAFDDIHPDDRGPLRDQFEACLDTGEPYETEVRFTTPDGEQRWLAVRAERTKQGSGNVVRGYVRDLTAQTERRQELERRNDLFEKAQKIADIGAWAHDVEREILTWTDQVYEIHGVSTDFEPSLDSVQELYHPEDQPKLREAVSQAVTAGEPYDLRVRITSRDDGVHWVRTVADPQTEDGDVVRVRGIVHDITDRVEREQELRQYEHFFKNSPDQIALLDENLTVQYQSPPSSLHELDAINVEGDNLLEYVHPDDRQTLSNHFEQVLTNPGESFSEEFRAEDMSGEWRWVETRAINLLDEEPADGILVMIRDITQQKRQEFKRKRQNERLDEFASIVSHDLRNPLNVAKGHLELAQETDESEHLGTAADALDRSQALIEDLLTLAREGEAVDETEPVALADAAESSWQTVETGSGTLEIDAAQTIDADRSRLKQLLENLYRNAVEHGGDDITVSVGDMNNGFYVADAGPGIPEGDRETVFEAGYSTSADGTGFGLRIIEQIVDAHGWEIQITDSDDGGARFEVTGVDSRE